MSRFFGILLVAAAIGCGTPAYDTGVVASSEAIDESVTVDVEVTPVEFNLTGAPVVELDAPGMHCEVCAASIVKAIKSKPGVVDVKADAETKVVSVAVSETEFESDFAIEAIAEAGFGEATLIDTVEPIEDEAEPTEES